MLRVPRQSSIPSLKWCKVFHAPDEWIVVGGSFWRLELLPTGRPRLEAGQAFERPPLQPEVTVSVRPNEWLTELFWPLDNEHPSLCTSLVKAGFAYQEHEASWRKRCVIYQELVATVRFLFAHLPSLDCGYESKLVVINPELIDWANAIMDDSPHWLGPSSSPFTTLRLNVRGVLWTGSYHDASGTFTLDCMGYKDFSAAAPRAFHGPARLPDWLLSRVVCGRVACATIESNDWATGLNCRTASDAITILKSLEPWLTPDIVKPLDVDSMT